MLESPPAFFLLALALFLQSSFLDLTALDPKGIRIDKRIDIVLRTKIRDLTSLLAIVDTGFLIMDNRFVIRDTGFLIMDNGSVIRDIGFRIMDYGLSPIINFGY